MESVKVGIAMPTINLWDRYTMPAITSVHMAVEEAAKHGIERKFLLIDNASTDATKQVGPTISYPEYEYHRNDEMWGFQKTVNFAVKTFLDRGFDYVLVLNNDIVLHPAAIWRLVECFKKHEGQALEDSMHADRKVRHLGMATCLDVTGECQRNPQLLMGLSDKMKESAAEAPHPCFSAFMVNRLCWSAVGEFDEIFAPAYFEDNDYHYRITLAEMDAVVYPPAMFLHYGSRTQQEALGRPLLTNNAFENNRASYVSKWGGMPGQETFKHPFNDEAKSFTSTKQNA